MAAIRCPNVWTSVTSARQSSAGHGDKRVRRRSPDEVGGEFGLAGTERVEARVPMPCDGRSVGPLVLEQQLGVVAAGLAGEGVVKPTWTWLRRTARTTPTRWPGRTEVDVLEGGRFVSVVDRDVFEANCPRTARPAGPTERTARRARYGADRRSAHRGRTPWRAGGVLGDVAHRLERVEVTGEHDEVTRSEPTGQDWRAPTYSTSPVAMA